MMRARSELLIGFVAITLGAFESGCNQSTDVNEGGSGGKTTSSSGGVSGTGGVSSSGGQQSGGSQSSGGSVGSGGVVSSGGVTTSGGSTSSGGRTTLGTGGDGRGGETGTGGMSSSGGRTNTGTGSGGRMMPDAGASGGAVGSGGTGAPVSTGPITFPPKFAGNIDTRGSIRSDFSKYWDQFSPENAGKWGSVQSSQSSFNWNSLDAMYKYCNDNNIIFKQHNFVWGAQQPGWTSSLTTTTGPTAVQNWMSSFCQRYPNTKIIDVVNEPPPHTTPAYANAIGGGTNSTWDWIANAFKWARAACPNAVLVLNDYNNDELSGDTQHTIDIVNAIKKAGAPIDAVGCQTHGAGNLPSSTLKTNIDKIASSTGLPVYITEYDLNIADDNQQQQKMQDHFTMFWTNNNIKGVTYWGYIVGATWVANSGLIQSSGTLRPAMTWLMGYLKR